LLKIPPEAFLMIFLQGEVGEFGAGNELVQIGHIGRVVLAVVVLDGFLRDMRASASLA